MQVNSDNTASLLPQEWSDQSDFNLAKHCKRRRSMQVNWAVAAFMMAVLVGWVTSG